MARITKLFEPDDPERKAASAEPARKIQNILIIGAELEEDGVTVMRADAARLNLVDRFLTENGLQEGPPKVTVSNLAYGQNFTRPESFPDMRGQFDAVIISYLPGFESGVTEHLSVKAKDAGKLAGDFFQTVGQNHTPQDWRNALMNVGAPMIFTYGGHNEIRTDDLRALPYYVAQPSENSTYSDKYTPRGRLPPLNAWFGLMVSHGYAEEILNAQDRDSPLVRTLKLEKQIRELSQSPSLRDRANAFRLRAIDDFRHFLG